MFQEPIARADAFAFAAGELRAFLQHPVALLEGPCLGFAATPTIEAGQRRTDGLLGALVELPGGFERGDAGFVIAFEQDHAPTQQRAHVPRIAAQHFVVRGQGRVRP